MRLAAGAQQIDERFELGGREVPELSLVALANGVVELLKQGQAGFGDADLHDAAVVGHSLADDKVALGQAIQKPGDVRGMRDEPRSQGQRGEGRRMLGPEQPQGVVLLGGELVLRKELVLEHPQAVIRPPKTEINLLLG